MTEISYFPKNSDEAIAFLYVQRNAPGDATPEELAALYKDAYERIKRSKSNGFNVRSLT